MKPALKNFIFLFCICALLGCARNAAPLSIRRGHRGNSVSPALPADTLFSPDTSSPIFGQPAPDPLLPPPSVFLCGVSSGGGSVFIFRDGVKIKEIPVSESTCATADPDTHFLFSDSLYTTATSRGKTSMALDGKCLFSWNASEYIISVLPSAEGLWTLGNDRDGDGFALRLDGELKFSSLSGTASPMYRDQGQLCFSYRVTLGEYSAVYLVRDCSDIPVSPRYGGNVMDVSVSGGVLHMVENLDGFFRVWTAGTSEDHYPFPGFGSAGARLYRRGESGCAAVISLVGGATGMPLDMILEDGEEQLRGGGSASYHYYSEEDCAHVVLDRYGEKLSVMWNGEDVDIPGVMLQNERCAAIYDGQLYMALSSVEGERTYLLGGGRKTELKFSGALTAIDLSPPS